MRGRSIIDMRSTRTEELVLVEDELEVLSDEDVEEAWAELELEVALAALEEDSSAVEEEPELVGGASPIPTRPARSGERFLTIRPRSAWSRRWGEKSLASETETKARIARQMSVRVVVFLGFVPNIMAWIRTD